MIPAHLLIVWQAEQASAPFFLSILFSLVIQMHKIKQCGFEQDLCNGYGSSTDSNNYLNYSVIIMCSQQETGKERWAELTTSVKHSLIKKSIRMRD